MFAMDVERFLAPSTDVLTPSEVLFPDDLLNVPIDPSGSGSLDSKEEVKVNLTVKSERLCSSNIQQQTSRGLLQQGMDEIKEEDVMGATDEMEGKNKK